VAASASSFPTSPPLSSASTPPAGSSQTHHAKPLGPLLGGIFGGLAALAACGIALSLWWMYNQRRQQAALYHDGGPSSPNQPPPPAYTTIQPRGSINLPQIAQRYMHQNQNPIHSYGPIPHEGPRTPAIAPIGEEVIGAPSGSGLPAAAISEPPVRRPLPIQRSAEKEAIHRAAQESLYIRNRS
jgi:hypothetical protein